MEQMDQSSTSTTKFKKPELDLLIRRMKLSKENCVILLSFFKENELLDESVDVNEYDEREKEIEHFFDEIAGNPFIKDVNGLFEWLNYDYKPDEWILYSKCKGSKVKCLLIHKHQEYDPLPFLVSNEIEDPYSLLNQVLKVVNYKEHNWDPRGDFKMEIQRDFKS